MNIKPIIKMKDGEKFTFSSSLDQSHEEILDAIKVARKEKTILTLYDNEKEFDLDASNIKSIEYVIL